MDDSVNGGHFMHNGSSNLQRQRGQTLPVVVLFMFALLGFCALAIDAGQWYLTKRQLQSEADAVALAGASQIPAGWSAAQTAANSNFNTNKGAGDTVTLSNTTSSGGTANDSMTVQITRPAKTYFAKLFGFTSKTITAKAIATVQSVNTVSDGDALKPWGVMKGAFTYGQQVSLFGGLEATGNFGAIDLPVNPPSCGHSNGASGYRSNVMGAANGGNVMCPLSVGDQTPTEPGQMAGPNAQGLDTLIGSNTDTFASVVSTDANGNATILKDSPRIVTVPIITNTDGTTNWPNGKKNILIVGFAQFFISSWDKKTVTGTFIRTLNSGTAGNSGKWSTTTSGLNTISLTG
jgi:hypothetical protein